ncbi:RNA-binding domain-containing protein [Aaosphaeria arxii CBS 175.79]|uniref:RNA-binding domain-containing protein n=1 Tax=Aaosphaeria arxii CBS 175.79 TaxID=1450172 RepID=A0A6A5XB81_9PLEO|nr:RNA-binding domain-containing protein [Aaosphaeria arxii CBS 175.79]KAF2010153.1 RNA-binding domain-containing protein [Aaosphaeria arxii CBS 175.79]
MVHGPWIKRQRLSVDGAEAVTATVDAEQPTSNVEPLPNDEEVRKQNLQQRRSLFIRSLAPSVTTEHLTELFSESYPIKHALAVLDPTTKQCKGYGFVTFADAEDAQRAKDELNGADLQGRKIRVEIAEPRHRDIDSEIPGHKKSTPAAASIKAKEEREQARKDQQPPKLILRNLPWSIKTPEDLSKLFQSYGKVTIATLPKKPNGELKGFGFVLLRGRKNAEKALENLNGKEIDGRAIAVDWAVDRDTWQNLQSAQREEEKAKADDAEDDSDAESSVLTESDEDSDEEDEEDEDEDEDEDDEDSNTDLEDISDDEDGGIKIEPEAPPPKQDLRTIFIRNLPFTADDDSLFEQFSQFGKLRYARVVMDQQTEKPKGTGFVSFVRDEDATNCLKGVPRNAPQPKSNDKKQGSNIALPNSVLENSEADPSGAYTMDGRVLRLSLAVDRNEAARLAADHHAARFSRDKDKRRLYLLSEGTIAKGSPLYEKLSPSEVTLRESSAKQRQKLIQTNPSLHVSLTRLSIRNIPRSITSKDLKALARQAIVGFASDVKASKRQGISREELTRGFDAAAELHRKTKGKGLVKQAKVVFETEGGSKVTEGTGAGRSRGYGFIEYYTHRNALMGLRWLNGHAVDYKVKTDNQPKSKKTQKEAFEDKKKRLIVEFALENANVVHRRSDRENKAREFPKPKGDVDAGPSSTGGAGNKRKRDDADAARGQKGKGKKADGSDTGERGDDAGSRVGAAEDDKLAQRSRIIRKKRMARRAKKGGKA